MRQEAAIADTPRGDDLEAIDWTRVALPPAWPDLLDLRRPGDLLLYLRRQLGRRRPVELPPDLPVAERLPDYLLQEFHHLPNGNYSLRLASAYVDWFDFFMLGTMPRARARVADALSSCRVAIDLGCGGGGLAGELLARGTHEVWGIDASPYLLREAAERHPGVRFVQGLVERSRLPAARFAGAGACFLFHELPPSAADAALIEIRRILEPGGILAVTEPSPEHLGERSARRLWRLGGARGVYFGVLARFVHEPLVDRWHGRDVAAWLDGGGFELLSDETHFPFRSFVARARV